MSWGWKILAWITSAGLSVSLACSQVSPRESSQPPPPPPVPPPAVTIIPELTPEEQAAAQEAACWTAVDWARSNRNGALDYQKHWLDHLKAKEWEQAIDDYEKAKWVVNELLPVRIDDIMAVCPDPHWPDVQTELAALNAQLRAWDELIVKTCRQELPGWKC